MSVPLPPVFAKPLKPRHLTFDDMPPPAAPVPGSSSVVPMEVIQEEPKTPPEIARRRGAFNRLPQGSEGVWIWNDTGVVFWTKSDKQPPPSPSQ